MAGGQRDPGWRGGTLPFVTQHPSWVMLECGVHAPSLALVLGRGIAGSTGCRPLLERQPTVRKCSTQHGPLLPVQAERGQLVFRWKP